MWEDILPRLQALGGIELDLREEMLSGAWDPRFGDEAAVPKRISCVVEVVDNVIQGFCWEPGIRHRGFREDGIASVRRSVDCVDPDSRLFGFPSSSPSEIPMRVNFLR